MKRPYVFVTVAAIVLSAFAGLAVAAQPCGKGAIQDWYDNGIFDQPWDCECLRDAIDRLPDHAAPYSSARGDFQRQLLLRGCEGSSQQVLTATLATPTVAAGAEQSRNRVAFVIAAILAVSGIAAVAWWLVRRQQREA